MGGAVKKQRIGHSRALAGIICVLGGLVAPALAQDVEADEAVVGGTVLTFGVETTLSVSDNYSLEVDAPGTSTILDTVLSFGYLSETAVDRFAFDVDGVLRASELPGAGGDFRFDDPDVALSYAREGANSRFSIEADYGETNLDFIDPFEFVDDGILTEGAGIRETRSARLIFETGTSDPLGFGVELGHEALDYRDTTDTGLFDNQTDDIALTARLRLSPVLEGRARLSYEDYSAEDLVQTERTTRALSFGAAYEISPILFLDATLGVEDIEDTETGDDVGAFGTVELTRALPNGSVGVTLDRSFGIEGGRTTLSVNRAMDLPSGTLAFSIGVTEGEIGNAGVVGSIDYTQTLARGAITASLERRVVSSSSGNNVLTTEAALGYTVPTTAVSSLSFDFDYVEVEEVGTGTFVNTNRSSLRATYSHELTPDWDLSAGYEYQREVTDGSGTANSNTVFMTLGREFSIRR